jgi:FdrA protein
MVVRTEVRRTFYRDSVALMRLAETVQALPGVREAAALMGTPANQEVLAAAGLATPETSTATPADLVLAVRAESEVAAAAALAEARRVLDERRAAPAAAVGARPRSLDGALRLRPDANLAAISVPGAYAALEARQALERGLHVFLFSDHVPLADEVALKRRAARRGLLCMGPDCGTAYVGGVGLGFANVVPRGGVGCVAASGTGLQAVAARVAAHGGGLSHGLGVGGRDLSAEVGGAMTMLALEALAGDPETEVVVVISKPPAPGVLARLDAALEKVGKPVVVCCLGAPPRTAGAVRRVATLADAADAAVAVLRGAAWTPRAFADPAGTRARLARLARADIAPGLVGLYTGGTLADEARLLLEPLLGPAVTDVDAPAGTALRIVDLGGDRFTVGRPHPMLDPEARAARVREVGRTPGVGVLLLDLVLGRGGHADPAGPLAAAVADARREAAAAGRQLVAVASVIGTRDDPQGLDAQIATLERAGVELLPSNAEAARFAALAVRPDAPLLDATP